MADVKLSFKEDGRILFTQDGQEYDLNHLPDGFEITGSIDLSGRGLTELPDLSKVVVKGNFNCSGNHLTSLEGAPKGVRFFNYSNNPLTGFTANKSKESTEGKGNPIREVEKKGHLD